MFFDIAQDCFADKVAAVKNLICHLLIVWLAVFAGGANAHGIGNSAHETAHTGHVHSISVDSGVEVDADQANADRASPDIGNACSQSHCGHGHNTGILTAAATCSQVDAVTDAPLSSSRWASAAIADNIERPKWPFTTPAVVSLLS